MRAGLPTLLVLVLTASAARAQDPATIVAADRDATPEGYRFEPARLEVPPGAVVLVVARGDEPHTLSPVAAGALNDTRVDVGGRVTFSAPRTPGEYPFYCRFHATPETSSDEGMAGVLVVREAALTTTPSTPAEPDATPWAGPAAFVALTTAAILLSRRR